MIRNKKVILISIVLLALFLRVYNASLVPPSPSLDEVSIGYNAYSILKTGADEFGEKFPILLRAYDDFRPAFYVYLVVPFIWLLDISILAVRLPSVILSILSVWATYFLVRELLKDGRNKESIEQIAVLSTLLLAISPWHIYISRLGHEVNAGLSFFIFGLLFFFKNKIPLSIIFLCLSFISYQTEKVFLPLFIFFLGILYWKKLWANKKTVIISIIGAVVVLSPFINASLSNEGLIRFKGTNIITAREDVFQKRAIELAKAKEAGDIVGQLLNNRRTVAMELIAQGYFSHFKPQWLFTNSGKENHKVPNMGLLYVWEIPFLIAGLFFLLTRLPFNPKLALAAWIIVAPLSSALTTDAPHAMRSIVFLPAFQIVTALGIFSVYSALKLKRMTIFVLSFFVVVILYSIWTFSSNYFLVFPKEQSASFQYSLHAAMQFANHNKENYKKIVISNKDHLYQSYMFYLYNAKVDPGQYQNIGGTKSGGYAEEHKFENYEFRPFDFTNEFSGGLYIGNRYEFPVNASFVKVFKNLDGKEVIFVVEK